MAEMNFDVARANMIAQQIRTWDVLDQRVLDLVARIPREDFVPANYRKLAFVDMNIPLGRGEVMLPPKFEARILQELDISPNDTILEIGTGSGYMTALLASLGKHVYSIDIVPEFKVNAEKVLAAQGISNVTLEVGDAARGWNRHAPYDVVVVTGSVAKVPAEYRTGLADGGRLAVVVGKPPVMELKLIKRVGDCFEERSLFETVVPALSNSEQPEQFVF